MSVLNRAAALIVFLLAVAQASAQSRLIDTANSMYVDQPMLDARTREAQAIAATDGLVTRSGARLRMKLGAGGVVVLREVAWCQHGDQQNLQRMPRRDRPKCTPDYSDTRHYFIGIVGNGRFYEVQTQSEPDTWLTRLVDRQTGAIMTARAGTPYFSPDGRLLVHLAECEGGDGNGQMLLMRVTPKGPQRDFEHRGLCPTEKTTVNWTSPRSVRIEQVTTSIDLSRRTSAEITFARGGWSQSIYPTN